MTKRHSTKHALIASILILCLCFTTLIGTTFAWFTDSVSSSGNKIVAGSLKIDLELYDKETDKWNSIKESQAPVFNYEYWEPGYVDAQLLKVENEGNLALKWKAKFVSNTELGILADVIDVYVKPSETELSYPASRDLTAEGYVRVGTIREFVNSIESTTYGVLENKGDVAYLGIALKMQETAGNEYQAQQIGAFDIQIVAAQLAYEGDSFGPNYDANAPYPVVSENKPLPEADSVADIVLDTTRGTAVTVPAAAVENIIDNTDAESVSIGHTEPIIDTDAKSITFDNFDLVDENGTPIDLKAMNNTTPIFVTINVGDAFEVGTVVTIYHDGEPVASAPVVAVADVKTVTYSTTHFCRVDINYGDGVIDSVEEFTAAISNGGNVKLESDITVTETIVIPEGKVINLDLNGKTITTSLVKDSTTNHLYAFENYGKLVITGNGTINARGIFNYANMVLENGTINAIDGNGGYAVRNYAGATFTMNGGTIATTFEDDNKVNNGGYDATTLRVDEGAYAEINGGIIDNICDYTFAIDNLGDVVVNDGIIKSVHSTVSNYGTITVNGGSFTCNGLEGVTAHALVAWDGSTTTVNGGTFDGKDNYNGFNVDACKGADVVINGGNFLSVHSGSLYGEGTINVYGGTFFDDPSARVATGFKAYQLADGTWTVDTDTYVARNGDNFYTNLQSAVDNVNDGDTIVLIKDVTFSYTNGNYYNNGGYRDGLGILGDKSFTLDLNGKTLTNDSTLNDYLIWIKNSGEKANTITFKNGTLDATSAVYCALVTASSHDNKLTVNLENIVIYNNRSNGSTVKIRAGSELNVKAGTKITGKDSYLAIENWKATVNIYDGAELYMNGKSSYNGCLAGAGGGGVINVYGGYGKGVKGGFIAMTSGGTINVYGGEWIANTDGSIGDNSNLYVLTAQSNKYESGFVGGAYINVYGGTFRGGMDAWVLNNLPEEEAKLVISGGNFNANPASYLADGYDAIDNGNGTYTAGISFATFLSQLESANYVFDGNDVTVVLKDSEYNHFNGSVRQFYIPASTVNINSNLDTLEVKNVKFVFVDDDTTNTFVAGELQTLAKNVTFENCIFDNVSVSPWETATGANNCESATFTNCEWENLTVRYGVHQSKAKNLSITGCSFNSVRGIHVNNVIELTVKNNNFTGIGDNYGVLCLSEGITVTPAKIDVSGNNANGQTMLRQLSNAVTAAQVNAISENNTYNNLYVTGSIVPAN